MKHDPYALRPEDVEDPPPNAWRALSRLGPGMVLAAAIVGSGELIATTTLGAQAGYVALWVVLLSCAVKPAVQAELGRYTIATGETGLEALDRVPGPRLGVSWILWAWAATVLLSLLQVGGMYGGLAQVLNLLVPAVPSTAWALVLLALTLALVLGGGYERVERLALVKVALFTLLTVFAAIVLTRQGEHFSWGRVAEGLRFRLPETGFATAVAVFGITGVGATELFMYPYWCVEKGYARFVGPNDGSPSRLARARGWIRLMHADVAASMVLYSLATLAFYLLGAGILHTRGLNPGDKGNMIPVLSNMYTQTLGSWALPLFYLGAIATLYGTIFAATAAESRVAADLCRLLGKFEPGDYTSRIRYRKIFVWVLTCISAGLYLMVQSPVSMVKAGGVAQAAMLPPIAIAALYLRYRQLPKEVWPKPWITVGLWIASLTTIALMGYYAVLLVTQK